MDQLANLNRQLAEVHATQARLAEMEKELKTLIAAATAAAEAKQVQEAKQALQDIYTKMKDLPQVVVIGWKTEITKCMLWS